MNYPKKYRFQFVPIAALCLHIIQRENLVFKNSLCSFTVTKIGKGYIQTLKIKCFQDVN